jgi:hypothetical protein
MVLSKSCSTVVHCSTDVCGACLGGGMGTVCARIQEQFASVSSLMM